jgi:uncharacterized RDD family membrane protein YckC
MSEERVTIETPEHIQVSYELAGIGSRALAGLFDTLLQGLLTTAVVLGLLWLSVTLNLADTLGVAAGIIIGALGFLVATAYFVVSEMTMNGQSPGKRLAGLRVVRDDGTPITFLDSAIRNIIRAVDLIPFFYTVGLIAVFFSKRSKRLGDLAAGTIVVKERLYEQPGATPLDPSAAGAPTAPLAPEVEMRLRNSLRLLGPADFEAAERFLERRFELEPNLREKLLRRVALPIIAKMPTVSAADFPSLGTFLEAILRLRQERPL